MVTAEALIDLAALKQNYQTLKAKSLCNQVVAVVKGDAYGHGSIEVAKALNTADKFAVSRIEEAIELRDAGISQPILLLEGCFCSEDLHIAAEQGFETVIHETVQLDDFLAAHLSQPVKVWLKIDTGMHRVGFHPQEVPDCIARLSDSANLLGEVNFVSHFSCADNPDSPKTAMQLELFEQCTQDYKGERSIANSAAILNWQQAHYDWVRAGIALYGISPDSEKQGADYQLSPVMTLRSKLIAVREHSANQPVGYGEIWRSEKKTKIGVVALGYGDGYPRLAPQGTPVWLNGREVPIAGRVSMDMITIDLGADSEDKPGDTVEFWGPNLPVEKVADCVGTIPYELTIKLTRRVVKNYLLG